MKSADRIQIPIANPQGTGRNPVLLYRKNTGFLKRAED
jgi:hypothetical protein